MSVIKNQELYKKAVQEAANQHLTLDEWIESAVERQLAQVEKMRAFVAEKSKGANKAKALSSLRKFAMAGEGDPVEGDEMPRLN